MSWKPYNVRHWGSKSKSPFHFLHSEFFTITYKPLKATLLWATRLVIGCICFCWISPQYFNLFCIMFNSRNPYERLHYPWFCKKSPPIILFLIKGTVHPKMKILSSFTHPHVIPNLYKFLSYVEHKRRYFEEFWWTKKLLAPIDFITVIKQWMVPIIDFHSISSILQNYPFKTLSTQSCACVFLSNSQILFCFKSKFVMLWFTS